MRVCFQIGGREAVPVRAIPLVTNWEVLSPDELVELLARPEVRRRGKRDRLTAYRVEEQAVQPLLPIWWENFARVAVTGVHERLNAREASGELTREEGYRLWRSESLQALPAGVFVWRDELEECFRHRYGADSWSILGEDGLLSAEEVAERVRLDFFPFVDPSIEQAIRAGFETHLASTSLGEVLPPAQDRAALLSGFLSVRVGDEAWATWTALPLVEPNDAAYLLSGIDPDNPKAQAPARSLLAKLSAIARDGKERTLLDWIADHVGQGGKAGPPIASAAAIREEPTETQEERQARRYQACIDDGLAMPTSELARLPAGLKRVAAAEGVTRQTFAQDVKAHIARLNGR